jgi:hypothetical protein
MNFFSIIKGELDTLVSSTAFQQLEANERTLVLGFLHQLVLSILAVLERPVSLFSWCLPSAQETGPSASGLPYSSTSTTRNS